MSFTRYNSVYSSLNEANKKQAKPAKKPTPSKPTTPKIPEASGKSSGKPKKLKKEQINSYFINLKRKLKEKIDQDPENEELYDQYNKIHQLHKEAMGVVPSPKPNLTPKYQSMEVVSEVDDSFIPENESELTTYIPAEADHETDHYDSVMDNSIKEDDFDFSPEESNTDVVDYSSYHDEDSVDSYDTLMSKTEPVAPKEEVYNDYEDVSEFGNSKEDYSELDEDNSEKALEEARRIRQSILSKQNKKSFKEDIEVLSERRGFNNVQKQFLIDITRFVFGNKSVL